MKINNPLRAKKFVIKYSKTLNRQFLEIKVLEGPTIPLEAACAYVIMVSLIYRRDMEALTPKRRTARRPQKRSNFNQFVCKDIH